MTTPRNPTAPAIGVVIPTYNRANDLLECLNRLDASTYRDFEVIVVDDGSTDHTRDVVTQFARTASFPLRYLHQQNSGPACARNLGIRNLTAPIAILIGDDIFASPRFLEVHLAHHQAHPELQAVAVGLTRWSVEGQVVTPFMRWLDEEGMQFNYRELEAGAAPTWMHFYTSNLSFKTAYLRANPFHEGFRTAAMEDIELGYRLAQDHALHMSYLPAAVAEHLHPTTFQRACRRMVGVGEASLLLAELWPDMNPATRASRARQAILACLTEPKFVLPGITWVTDTATRLLCPNPLLDPVMRLHYRFGYRRALRAAGSQPSRTS